MDRWSSLVEVYGIVEVIVPDTPGEGEVWIMFNIMDMWRAGMKIYRPVEGKEGLG